MVDDDKITKEVNDKKVGLIGCYGGPYKEKMESLGREESLTQLSVHPIDYISVIQQLNHGIGLGFRAIWKNLSC